MLGIGTWTAYLQRRGGSPVVLPIATSRISCNKPLDNTGQANLSIPIAAASGSGCCEIFNEAEPWRDEVIIYRNSDVVHVGPLVTIQAGDGGGSAFSQDLFFWLSRRFLEEDFFFFGDVSDIFERIIEVAMAPDNSPNLTVVTHETGEEAVRQFKGTDFIPAMNVISELSRTALDYTMIGRTVYAGGAEVFTSPSSPATPLILHDGGVLKATLTRDGAALATDVSVYGGAMQDGPHVTVTHGRATEAIEVFGLVQQTFTELTILDTPSADANALTRLRSMLPTPTRLTATLSPFAGFEYSDLIPGRRVDVRLANAAGCGSIDQVMRLVNVSCDVGFDASGFTEDIKVDLIPLGTSEATT